jgi:hypothetical protein
MSHNLRSASVVDSGGRALRKRQVDVGRSALEGFKELFQVFSLTQRHVTPDGNCMSLSVAESEQHDEDFEGVLVNEKRDQQLGALEGERQRTVKEWCTFMGQPTEYGDNILLQAITMHLKKLVKVFSYDSKDDTVYMQTIACGILSK